MQIPNFVYIAILLFAAYYFFVRTEDFNNAQTTKLVVENAFSDTRCIEDNLPLVRFHPRETPNTFRCLSVDGSTCIDRNTVAVPAEYPCKDARKNVNYFLTVDGLRNAKVNPNLPISKVFNDFEKLGLLPDDHPSLNKNVKFMTCTPDGLKDENHWCGQVWNTINAQCNTPRGRFGEFAGVCKEVPNYINSGDVGTPVVEQNYTDIARNQKAAMAQTQSTRASNVRGRGR